MIVEIIMGSGAIASGEVEAKDMPGLIKILSGDGYLSVKDSNGVKLVNKRNILYVRRKR